MIRSSIGLIVRLGRRSSVADNGVGLQQLMFRCLSSSSGNNEKPKIPEAPSSELQPVGGEANLPANLIDFQVASKIEGEESHIATVNLRPGETLRAEAGAMLFMTDGVEMDTSLSGASSAFTRMMTGMCVVVGYLQPAL